MSTALQTWLARTGLGRILGMQMGGARDMYGTFGWKTNPCFKDFWMKYKRQGIARRIVNSYPDALWADPPVVTGDDTFQKVWQDLLATIAVFPTLQKLDKLCRIGRFAVLVVGMNDGQQLNQPVRKLTVVGTPRKIIYLQPYCEESVEIVAYETNTASERYGLPTMYRITPGEFDNLSGDRTLKQANVTQKSFDVHYTRVLHVAESALESPVYGSSCLEPIFNDLYDLEKVSGGSAEAFWLNSNRGMHIDVDKEMELKDEDAAALSEEIDEYSNGLRRIMRTRGVKVTNLGTDFNDPSNTFDVILSNISACTGIPKNVLMGSETGQLASQQDRANWADRIGERISEYGNPVVLMPFLRLCIDAGVLPAPSTLSVNWPDAFKMNPLERAQTSAQMARTAANLSKTLYTVQQINHANAVDSTPQPMAQPGGFGGFGANATTDPTKSSKGTSKTPSGAPPDAKGQGGNLDPSTPPEPQMQPALLPGAKTDLVLLTEDECRKIIGFGKHMPVFDSTQDSTQPIGSTTSKPENSSVPAPSE